MRTILISTVLIFTSFQLLAQSVEYAQQSYNFIKMTTALSITILILIILLIFVLIKMFKFKRVNRKLKEQLNNK